MGLPREGKGIGAAEKDRGDDSGNSGGRLHPRHVILAPSAQVVVHAVVPDALLLLAGELVLASLREVHLRRMDNGQQSPHIHKPALEPLGAGIKEDGGLKRGACHLPKACACLHQVSFLSHGYKPILHVLQANCTP